MELTLDQALQKGVEAHKAGQSQEADRYYTAILKANPKHPDANHNMGVLAVGIGKVEAAIPFFKTALEANPKIAQFWLSYIDALIKLDRITDAKRVFDQAKSNGAMGDVFDQLGLQLNTASVKAKSKVREDILTQPNILDAIKVDKALKLASKKVNDGLSEEAEKIYQDILNKFPKNKKALDGKKTLVSRRLANVLDMAEPPSEQLQSLVSLYTQGQYQQALSTAYQLLKQFPNSINLYNITGAANNGLGKQEEAVEAYRKAISIKPDYAEAYNNMGNALKDQGKQEEAVEAYRKAISIKPDYAEAYYNVGSTLRDQGKLDNAIGAYTKAISIKPDYAAAYYNMGNSLKDQGKLDNAIEVYRKALSIKHDHARTYNNMGNALKEQRKLVEATEAFTKALSIKPDFAEAYNNMGNALQDQGKLDNAIEAYTNAISTKPDLADAHNNMGNALKEQGKLDNAIEAYRKALAIKPDFAEAYNNMGVALKEYGKLGEAIEAFTNSIFIKPDFANAIGNVYSLGIQISDAALVNEEFEKRLESHSLELIEMPKLYIQQAIGAFLLSDQKLVRRHLNVFSNCLPSSIAALKVEDQVFCAAYFNLLTRLIARLPGVKPPSEYDSAIFNLGESHCLSYAHKKIKMRGIDYTVVPKITFGAKAYHFSLEKESSFKAITKANFLSLPNGSKVFLSFGEIDCRPNEGFISAATKLNRVLENIVSDTVQGYVNWFATQNQNKNHSLFF